MPVVEVHWEPLKRRYTADCLSWACFINFLLIAGAFILPLYIVHASGNMWLKDTIHYEQLDITYQNRLIIQLQGIKGTNNNYQLPFTTIWSTSRQANDLYGSDSLKPMIVKSYTKDYNYDTKMDELHIIGTLPLQNDEVITSATVLAFMDAELTDITRFSMDAVVVTSASAGIPVSRIDIDGDISLNQKSSLPTPTKGIYSPYLPSLGGIALPNIDSPVTINEVLPSTILAVSRQRNYTLNMNIPAILYTPDMYYPGSTDLSTLATTPRSFEVHCTYRIPIGPVTVRPRISEELKHGWIQYVAFLVLTVFIAYIIRWAFFTLRIIETAIIVDAPRSTTKLHVA